MVERQLRRRGHARRWLAIEAFVENRADGAVGSGADLEAAAAGGLEPFCAVLAGQAQDAEAGAEALLGMGPAAQDDLDQGGGVGSDDGGLAPDALVRPAGEGMCSGTVVWRPRMPPSR
jgi:hypothetical protein